MEKILLTGATGFLGSYLARALLKKGYKVFALKREHSNLYRLLDIKDQIKFYDLEHLDLKDLFIENGPFKFVIHCATCYGRSGESSEEIFESNVSFPTKLLLASITFNTVTFINTDTFFNTEIIYSSHLNDYARSKKKFIEMAHQIVEGTENQFINIKLEHVYGPHDGDTKFIVWLIRSCIDNHSEIKLTIGEQQRDFIYIDDVISAYMTLIARHQEFGNGLHQVSVGTGQSISIRALAEMVHLLTGSKSQLQFGHIPYARHELMHSGANLTQMANLNWKPLISLDKGLKIIINSEMQKKRI